MNNISNSSEQITWEQVFQERQQVVDGEALLSFRASEALRNKDHVGVRRITPLLLVSGGAALCLYSSLFYLMFRHDFMGKVRSLTPLDKSRVALFGVPGGSLIVGGIYKGATLDLDAVRQEEEDYHQEAFNELQAAYSRLGNCMRAFGEEGHINPFFDLGPIAQRLEGRGFTRAEAREIASRLMPPQMRLNFGMERPAYYAAPPAYQ